MNKIELPEDLHVGRGWLNRAAEMLDSCEDHLSDAEFARAAASIGNGFIALAHAERAATSEPALTAEEAFHRDQRARAEARPHDDEPARTVVHVVSEDDGCVLHAASTAGKAEQWLLSTAGNREARDALSITELVVDRG